LSRYASKVKKGSNVKQGQVIGYVGASGLATGPHLDFRMKKNGRFVNPLKMRFPAARPVPKSHISDFKQRITYLEEKLNRLLAQTQFQEESPRAFAVSVNK
jgi:murein DD-endopeptidase MepM/ murein hydrolase activator NlpD